MGYSFEHYPRSKLVLQGLRGDRITCARDEIDSRAAQLRCLAMHGPLPHTDRLG